MWEKTIASAVFPSYLLWAFAAPSGGSGCGQLAAEGVKAGLRRFEHDAGCLIRGMVQEAKNIKASEFICQSDDPRRTASPLHSEQTAASKTRKNVMFGYIYCTQL